jgi:hypothetical protein
MAVPRNLLRHRAAKRRSRLEQRLLAAAPQVI